MKKVYTDFLIRTKDAAKLSYDVLQERTGISAPTLCRYFKGESDPTMDTMERIVEAMGANMKDLYACVGEQEIKASEKHDYKGTDALIEDFKQREAIYKEHCEQRIAYAEKLRESQQQSFDLAVSTLERNHASALAKRDETFERSTAYLKSQIAELKQDNKDLLERASRAESARELLDKRHQRVFFGMLAALLSVVALFIVFIVIDAPQIGAGW